MSDRISKCCGWGVHLGGIPSADPTAQVTEFYACDQCMKACDVETIEQRDHRMRVEGAMLLAWDDEHDDDCESEWDNQAKASTPCGCRLRYCERIVAEYKEEKHGTKP